MLSILSMILFFILKFLPYFATNLAYYSRYSQKMYYTKYKYDRLHHIASSLSFSSCIVTLLKLECSPPVQTLTVL